MSQRTPLISGNWKMHHNHFEALQLVQKLSYLLTEDDYDAVDVSVHPPFTDLRTVQTYLISEKEPLPILLGAQHCHDQEKGAFTGEVSPAMLAKLDVVYVIVGHSERRELFGETDETVNLKVKAIVAAGMTPIMCCGETDGEHRREASAGGRCGGDVGVRHQPAIVEKSQTAKTTPPIALEIAAMGSHRGRVTRHPRRRAGVPA